MALSLRFPHAVAALSCLAAVALVLAPAPEGVSGNVSRAAGVVTLAVGLWATAVVPEFFTAIVFFFLAVVLAVAPPDVVFSGFHSSAVWLVFGGLVIGVAVQSTGLGARIAATLMGRFQGSYLGILAGTVLVAAALIWFVPSGVGRVVIMLPIVLALADRLGFAEGSNGRAAMALAMGAGTLYPSFAVLPAAVPNLGMLGAAESIHGITVTFGQYLALQFPVIGTVSIVVLPFILAFLFPDRPGRVEAFEERTPISGDERKLVVVLVAALALWMTDFAHGISPAWVALGAAVLCLMPRIGVIPPRSLIEKVNLGPWFFVAGLIGMGAVVTESGLGDAIGGWLFSVVELVPGAHGRNFAAVAAIGMGMGMVATMPGQPAIMSALAGSIAEATGWPLTTALMVQTITWPMVLFPYELPPIVVTMQLAGVRTGQAIRLLVAMTAVAWLAMLPLQYLWWRYLGMFG